MLRRWESVESYVLKVTEEMGSFGPEYARDRTSDHWSAGLSFAQAKERALKGDPSLVGIATKALEKVSPSIGDAVRLQNVRTICGTRVSVPDYLGGSPLSMVKRVRAARQTTHVNIFVGIVSSQGLSSDQMLTRGATILGLLEHLQSVQVGVDLFLLAETHGRTDGNYVQCIRVESQPLDLSTAAFAIAHPAFARHITYAYAAHKDGFNGDWPRDWGHPGMGQNESQQKAWLKRLRGWGCDIADQDIYIPAPHYCDETMTNPSGWLEAKIRQVCGAGL